LILASLIEEFVRRFQHEKRARVCLWFDEKREFEGLLPKLREQLASGSPAAFELLRYEPELFHGQLWLKDQVRRYPPDRRIVIYLPLSEDRLDSPDESGENHLELLAEYRIAGVPWRLNGKQPTLFSFLRQADVQLPENPSEQRRLYDGGKSSLLAKYTSKFADRPASFWEGMLSADLVQSRLIGDLEKTALDLAASPETEWKALKANSLLSEFREMIHERYGYDSPASDPSVWITGFIEMVALTETYQGYGERTDFPFSDRLPPARLREHHMQLLRRWLKDADSRPVWERWIKILEPNIDLSDWAKNREGLSFGLPHLVALRWRQVFAEFEESAAKTSSTRTFFERRRTTIQREVEFSKANPVPVGSWELLASLDSLMAACDEGEKRVASANSIADLASVYVAEAGKIEREHLHLRGATMSQGLPSIGKVADRIYAGYTNLLNEKFFPLYIAQDTCEIGGFELVTDHLQREIWTQHGRRAVIIADALRLDAAMSIEERLKTENVEIHPMRAMLPTVTPIGMTAMLPLSGLHVGFEFENNQVHPLVNGKDAAARANRLEILSEFGAECHEIEEVENMSEAPEDLPNLLVVFGHETVDKLGHGSAETLIRHVDLEVHRLALLIRKLHRWGFAEVHVITDHGFVLLNEDMLPPIVNCERNWCHVRKERFALVAANADLSVATLPFAWDPNIRVALPPGLAFFSAEKGFSHGGAALQEIIIPHLVSRMETQERRIGIEILVPSTELMRSSVRVILRPKASSDDSATQLNLFVELGRSVRIDVLRQVPSGEQKSVLATDHVKEVRVEKDSGDVPVNLFFRSTESFRRGETLLLQVRDPDTSEQFPPGGTKLTVGRDM
jgi:hypothetical protein